MFETKNHQAESCFENLYTSQNIFQPRFFFMNSDNTI